MVLSPGNSIRYLIAGELTRNFVITPGKKVIEDQPGGSLLYSAAGAAIWESGIGLISLVGENYPSQWITEIHRRIWDARGIQVLPETIDQRSFIAFQDTETYSVENPVQHFSKLGLPFPRALLGYQLNNGSPSYLSKIKVSDIPADYYDATAAHIAPMDHITQINLTTALQQSHINTITLSPNPQSMNAINWEQIPTMVKGITAFIVRKKHLVDFFKSRVTDLWDMAKWICSYGCEYAVILRDEGGYMLYDSTKDEKIVIPPYPTGIIDPTGSADAFCGGFLVGYRTTYDPVDAVVYGAISASLTIEGSGPYYALGALPGLAQARCEYLKKMIQRV